MLDNKTQHTYDDVACCTCISLKLLVNQVRPPSQLPALPEFHRITALLFTQWNENLLLLCIYKQMKSVPHKCWCINYHLNLLCTCMLISIAGFWVLVMTCYRLTEVYYDQWATITIISEVCNLKCQVALCWEVWCLQCLSTPGHMSSETFNPTCTRYFCALCSYA